MTGFGRTGAMFATQHDAVLPDVMALGKGITGGYLPLGATVASGEISDAFLGEYEEFKTFFHGHSYSGNQLACAAARASLQLLHDVHPIGHIRALATILSAEAQRFWEHPNVGDVRCEGMICAVEIVRDFTTRERFPIGQRIGFHTCEAARQHGLLTRNIADVLVLMLPYCVTEEQIRQAVESLWQGLCEVLPTT
jgi:adenosylmethionine-8-amino-7-oxononanoate aminotransferase